MKTLKNQTLLYDADCPLCDAYTSGFIKTGMLDQDGKKSFACLNPEELNFLDLKRASNEIALIDNQNKTVIYGVDSLLKVLGNSFPWIEKIGKWQPIHFILKKLYSFISFNRKVIIPNKINQDGKPQCIPDFNATYRWLYIAFAGIVSTILLFKFSHSISYLNGATISRELLLTFGQLGFQFLFLYKLSYQEVLNYFGNLMTVSLIGSLLLLPLLFVNQLTVIPDLVNLAVFAVVVIVIFAEHFRRIQLLELPRYLCVTWIAYRFIALLTILYFIG